MSKPKLVTQAEFARIVGVSRGRIAALVRENRLDVIDGLIDLNGRKTKTIIDYYKKKKRSEESSPKPIAVTNNRRASKSKGERSENASIWNRLDSLDAIAIRELQYLDKFDIDKIKKFVDAQRAQQEMRVQRGELFDRNLMIRLIYKHYAIENSEMKTLGDRLTPEILADCHLDASVNIEEATNVSRRISDAILKSLEHIKKTLNNFLKTELSADAIK